MSIFYFLPLFFLLSDHQRHIALQQLKDTDPHHIVRPYTLSVSNAYRRGLVWAEFIRNANTQ